MKKINMNEEEMCIAYQNGITTKELAKKYGCHYCTILRHLHEYGIETVYLPILPMGDICKEYKNGISAKALGEKYDCDTGLILHRLRNLNIDIRSHLEANQIFRTILPEKKICKEYQNGMSLSKLAKKYNCSNYTIKRRLQEHNIKIRSRSESLISKLPDDEICKEYQSGIGSGKLAEKHGCERSTILLHLHECGVKVRTVTEANVNHTKEFSERVSAGRQDISYDEWEDYASKQKYCPLYNEVCKESNRNKHGRRCFICGKPESENITSTGRLWKLSVHHVDMDKQQGCNGVRWKLVPTCLECHGKLHNELWENRIIWLLNNVWNTK